MVYFLPGKTSGLMALLVSLVSINAYSEPFIPIGFPIIPQAQVGTNVSEILGKGSHFLTSSEWKKNNRYNYLGQKEYFEWWYYKLVNPQNDQSFYFVYSILNPIIKNEKILPNAHTKIELGDFKTHKIYSKLFSNQYFTASKKHRYVQFDKNVIRGQSAQAKFVSDTDVPVQWELKLENRWGFNAMGFGISFPKILGIYWAPFQADARATGFIEIAGKRTHIKDWPAYQDKNWGTSFPKEWFWIVSNVFNENQDASLACGGGKTNIANPQIPLPYTVNCGLFVEGKEYAFRLNHGDIARYNIALGAWDIDIINITEKTRLKIKASAPLESFMDLPFIEPSGNRFHDYETLNGKLEVSLFQFKNFTWTLKTTLHSNHAGLEFGSPGLQ